jgi:hypothetical protein
VQELMAASDIVINERVDIEVRSEGVVDLTVQRTVDLTVTADDAVGVVTTVPSIPVDVDVDTDDEDDEDDENDENDEDDEDDDEDLLR